MSASITTLEQAIRVLYLALGPFQASRAEPWIARLLGNAERMARFREATAEYVALATRLGGRGRLDRVELGELSGPEIGALMNLLGEVYDKPTMVEMCGDPPEGTPAGIGWQAGAPHPLED